MAQNDGEPSQWIDRRAYLRIGGGLAVGGTLALPGCTSDQDPGSDDDTDGEITSTGWLATEVTDQPNDIGDFERCVVTIQGVWLGPMKDGNGDESETDENDPEDETTEDEESTQEGSDTTQNESTSESAVAGSQPDDPADGGQGGEDEPGDGTENETEDEESDDEDGADDGDGENDGEDEAGGGNGRRYLEFDEPQEADLVQLQGDNTQLIDDREIEVGTYQFLQLDVDGVEGVLNDGSEADVETPGNAPLKFNESFDVREDTRTTFTADFTPVRRGNGSYLVRPVASGVEVTYGAVEDGETSGDGDETGDDGDGNETSGDEE